jgi:hypothetical protein
LALLGDACDWGSRVGATVQTKLKAVADRLKQTSIQRIMGFPPLQASHGCPSRLADVASNAQKQNTPFLETNLNSG